MTTRPAPTTHPAATIALVGGTSWYLWNFRRSVIAGLARAGYRVLAIAPEDEHTASLAGMPGVRWLDWPIDHNASDPLGEARALRLLRRTLARTRPALVLNHGIKPNIYGGLACRSLELAYANTVTGLGTKMGANGLAAEALARLYVFATAGGRAVFVQNPDDLAFLRARGLPATLPALRTFGSGVDLARFEATSMPASGPRTFLFVGRLQLDKGIVDFVEAARLLRAESPSVRCIAVGSTTHANRGAISERELERWRSEGVVELPGQQADVRPWLAAAHALVMPSHGGEGVPKVILEASAAARPTVASDVSGCRDAVVDGKTGFLHAPGDASSLAGAMRRLRDMTTTELEVMGRAARARAEADFSEEHLVEATLGLVRETLA